MTKIERSIHKETKTQTSPKEQKNKMPFKK